MKAVVGAVGMATRGSKKYTTVLRRLYSAVACHLGSCWQQQTLAMPECQTSALIYGERPRCSAALGLLIASDVRQDVEGVVS
jgi:hypothetical protein